VVGLDTFGENTSVSAYQPIVHGHDSTSTGSGAIVIRGESHFASSEISARRRGVNLCQITTNRATPNPCDPFCRPFSTPVSHRSPFDQRGQILSLAISVSRFSPPTSPIPLDDLSLGGSSGFSGLLPDTSGSSWRAVQCAPSPLLRSYRALLPARTRASTSLRNVARSA